MPRLWTQIAGGLGLLTLAVLVLNAGVFWIILEQGAMKRQTELASALGGAMQAQLGAAVRSGIDDESLVESVQAVGKSRLNLEQLVLLDDAARPLFVSNGEPPDGSHPGVRAALFAKEAHLDVIGGRFEDRSVVVSVPVVGAGKVHAVLQLRMPFQGPQVPGGAFGFALIYVAACGIIIALFGWVRLRQSLVAPIERLRVGTAQIAAGDLGHQLDDEYTLELQALVTSLNTMSAGLRDAQEALIRSDRLASVGRLSAGLAHEVGNPLAAVMSTVELLQGATSLKPEARSEMLRRAQVELERIHRIIQELLGYARAGGGAAEAIDLGTAIDDVLQTIQHQLDFRDFAVEVHRPERPAMVFMEPDKLRQVLMNIFRNAVDAPGAATLAVTVRLLDSGQVEILCIDNGHGFEPVALERAFEPFFTTKDVGEGTGLGLSTCVAVIAQAEGTIDVSNTPESGACVRIRLPSYPS